MRLKVAAGPLVVLAFLLVTGCEGGAARPPTGSVDVTVQPALAAKVPDVVKRDGVFVFGTDTSFPPNDYLDVDGQTAVGWDVELGRAVAAKLGLQPDFRSASFETIIPGVQSGKYEMGVSSFTVTAERQRVVDFVTYYNAGTAWAVARGNPKGIDSDHACGRTVGIQQGAAQLADVEARNAECIRTGAAPIQTLVRDQQTEITTDLITGKIDAMVTDSPAVDYAIKQSNGELQATGEVYDTAPYGFAIAKNASGLKDAVLGAVRELIADGTYLEILGTWGVRSGAIATPSVNGAPS